MEANDLTTVIAAVLVFIISGTIFVTSVGYNVEGKRCHSYHEASGRNPEE